jgi:hypothetical protein
MRIPAPPRLHRSWRLRGCGLWQSWASPWRFGVAAGRDGVATHVDDKFGSLPSPARRPRDDRVQEWRLCRAVVSPGRPSSAWRQRTRACLARVEDGDMLDSTDDREAVVVPGGAHVTFSDARSALHKPPLTRQNAARTAPSRLTSRRSRASRGWQCRGDGRQWRCARLGDRGCCEVGRWWRWLRAEGRTHPRAASSRTFIDRPRIEGAERMRSGDASALRCTGQRLSVGLYCLCSRAVA